MRRPHLHLHHVDFFVSDLERSLRFVVDGLGFRVLIDQHVDGMGRFVAVGPPDGQTVIVLVADRPGRSMHELIGRSSVVLVTDDVEMLYREWMARGVVFTSAPRDTAWGGLVTSLTDPDGNQIALMSHNAISTELEAERQRAADLQAAEQQALREMQIAREFQTRLLPQTPPASSALDYAGLCLQARQVGGDYYDFLSLGADSIGLVIGDISGKGIAAALLMANLQATLRGAVASAPEDPKRALGAVNTHLFTNTTASAYATLFFGRYRPADGRLRYVNCGHPPALLVRSDGSVDELSATTTVLGLFGEWQCGMGSTSLRPGDTLLLYTDGVTECLDASGDEFGPERLSEVARRGVGRPAQAVLDDIVDALRAFGLPEQGDDMTLIVAKRRSF
jgi:serine phosphatase RsbU (regulator of sigma subunit)/uncharacterized glyoxalase superfamily protein PhnB